MKMKELVHGIASGAGSGWVPGVCQEISLHLVEEATVVVLDLAELEEVVGGEGALLCVQIHHDVAHARDDQNRHPGRGPAVCAAPLPFASNLSLRPCGPIGREQLFCGRSPPPSSSFLGYINPKPFLNL